MGTALVAVGRLFPACRHFRHRRVMQRPRGASETPRGPRRRRGHPRCFFRPSRACCCRLSGGPYCRRGQSSGPLAVGGGAPPTVATTVVAVWRGATPASVAPRPLARRCCCRPRPLAWAVAALPACCRRPPRAVQQARRRCSPRLPPVSAVAVSALAVVSVALAVVVVVASAAMTSAAVDTTATPPARAANGTAAAAAAPTAAADAAGGTAVCAAAPRGDPTTWSLVSTSIGSVATHGQRGSWRTWR